MIKRILAALLLAVLLIGGFYAWKLWRPAVSNEKGHYFYIRPGEDLATIKERLIYQQLIKGPGFDLAVRVLRFKKVKPGRYQFRDGASLMSLVRQLRAGLQTPVRIVITKERTREMLAGKFGKKFDVDYDSLRMIRFLNSPDSLRPYGVDTSTVMTLIMPYTYEVNWNSGPSAFLDQCQRAYKKFWNPARVARADSLGLTPEKVMILASIVEEETTRKNDKLQIASTYLNRLRTGMKLQSCPTVIYALKGFGMNRVTGVHLKTVSPYNTYIHEGLPPGPICTPSLESIESVLNAPVTGNLYFVASYKFDGSTIFTKEYAEHQRYARLYQQELDRRTDSVRRLKRQP